MNFLNELNTGWVFSGYKNKRKISDYWLKSQLCVFNYKQENAMRCNNRDDLLQLNFILKISIFSEVYV